MKRRPFGLSRQRLVAILLAMGGLFLWLVDRLASFSAVFFPDWHLDRPTMSALHQWVVARATAPVALQLYWLAILLALTVLFAALCLWYRWQYVMSRKELADSKERLSLDSLTRLPGQEQAREVFAQLCHEMRRRAELPRSGDEDLLFLVFLDLCDFKQWNEHPHNHSVGDLVLREVAAFFAREKKGQDFVGRWGGDEFLMLLIAKGSALWPAMRSRQIALKKDGLYLANLGIIEVLFRCGAVQVDPSETVDPSENFDHTLQSAQIALQEIDKTQPVDPENRSTYFALSLPKKSA